MENNYFDKLFREKLENLEASDRAGSWELLQHRMAADPELSIPNEPVDPIDEIVKSKLEDTSASYEPGLWAMMEDKINADVDLNPQMDDVVFDGIAYENLNHLEEPYNPSHWELMAKRIQEEFSLQHRLYKYKIAEISLMLFAIFTLLQFLPIDKISIHNKKPAAEKIETKANIQQAFPTPPSTELNTSDVQNLNQQNSGDKIITDKVDSKKINPITTIAPLAIAKLKEKQTSTPEENLEPLPDFNQLNNTGTSAKPSLDNTLPLVAAQSTDNKQQTDANTATNDNQNESLANADNADLSITELLNINSSEMDLITYDEDSKLPLCLHCKRKKPAYIKAGMVFSTDLNFVMTPYNVKFEENSYGIFSAGYTGGLSLSVQKGRWEIGSSILYSSIKYEPKQNFEFTGSLKDGLVGEGLKSAQLNILSIPIHFNYTYAHAGKWHLYAVAGGSANMAAINHFDFKKFTVGGYRGGDPRVPNGHNDPMPTYKGVLEGGSLSDNLYITANLGLGAERYLNTRWSVFVQPLYQHAIFAKGIGPDGNRFNTFSIFAGAKATLR